MSQLRAPPFACPLSCAQACIILFTSAALFMFLSFVVYSGIVHKENLSPPAGSNPNPLVYPGTGHSGPGFALAVFSA